MIFWVSFLVALATAFFVRKKQFQRVWGALFNVLLAVYLSVVITVAVGKWYPDALPNIHYKMALLVLTAVMVFGIFQVILICCFGDSPELTFPVFFEPVFKPLLGFIMGYIFSGFVMFALMCVLMNMSSVGGKVSEEKKQSLLISSQSSVKTACMIMHKFSFQEDKRQLEQGINWISGIENE